MPVGASLRRSAFGRLLCGARAAAGERRTRPRAAAVLLRKPAALGARTGGARRVALGRRATPAACAPRRRRGAPPAIRPRLGEAPLVVVVACTLVRQSRGRVSGAAPLRRRGAQQWAGDRIAVRRDDERRLFEHRAQAARAARCRPREGEFGARPHAASTAAQSTRSVDRRSEAAHGTRPWLCPLERCSKRQKEAFSAASCAGVPTFSQRPS